MSLLLLMLAAGALFLLWQRMNALETRLSLLEWDGARPQPQELFAVGEPAQALDDTEPFQAAYEYTLDEPESAPADFQGDPRTADPEEAPPRIASRMPTLSFDFEEIFGRLLPIWAGGVALAVAGFFLVRFSIEAGLLTPGVRVALGFAFGVALVLAAEIAFQFEHRISDVRVRQSLAGAGLATLYASFYLAGAHYGLLGTTLSFLGLAAVTAAAIILSFRFGLPSAVLGLVGGFAAPTLVGGNEANVPLLALYLALITAGLSFAGQRQGRSWLGLAALAGGLGWGVLLLLSGIAGPADTLALGGYILVLGAAVPWLLSRDKAGELGRLIVPALATVQMAALVDQGEYGPLAWFLYVSLAAALGFFAWAQPRMRIASLLAAGTALWMLAFWPGPALQIYAAVAVALTAVFGVLPLLRAWRKAADRFDFAQICFFPFGLLAVTYVHFSESGADIQPALALVALGLASIPAAAAWRNWIVAGDRLPRGALAALASAATTLLAAGLIATPSWSAPLIGAAVAAGIIQLARGRQDRVANLGWMAAGATLLALVWTPSYSVEVLHLIGPGDDAGLWRRLVRWLAAALPFALLAEADHRVRARYLAEALTAVLVYGLAAQLLPWQWLPAAAALAGIALAWRVRSRIGASATLIGLSLLWAVEPVLKWTVAGGDAFSGMPMLLTELPTWNSVLIRVLPAALGGGATLFLSRSVLPNLMRWGWVGVGSLAAVAAHVVYKQLFGIASAEQFVALGLAERVVWELVLLGPALLFAMGDRGPTAVRRAATVMAVAAAAHFGWFTLLLHNPLWAHQWVGPWPIVNWLLPAYMAGVGSLLLLRRRCATGEAIVRPATDAVIMVLIAVYSVSALRQAFAGSLLQAIPVGQTEDLLRSLLGIVLALAFLMWGTWRGARSWRIGSLVLMLVAVLKVFLFDAASLEGLARIGSFMALGFSLIGIGWFYSKQLAGPKGSEADTAEPTPL